MLIMQTL